MGHFAGFGIGSYEQHQLRALPRAVDDVDAFHQLLGDGFTGEVVRDPDESAATQGLKALRGTVSAAAAKLLGLAGLQRRPGLGLPGPVDQVWSISRRCS